jgi:hypothetical protein
VSILGVSVCGLALLLTGVIDTADVMSVASRLGIRLGRQLEKDGA